MKLIHAWAVPREHNADIACPVCGEPVRLHLFTPEAAPRLGISVGSVSRLIRQRRLSAIQIFGPRAHWRICPGALVALSTRRACA